jgi:enoyl-CoA hydratase/carnithine racemase
MLQDLQSIVERYSGQHPQKQSPAAGAVRAIVLQHQGNVFSSGHDLRELKALVDAGNRPQVEELFRACSSAMTSIAASPVPVIAKVNGVATAAGCQLVASCDLAYATASSQFATPGVSIGLFCSTPAVALSRSVGRKASMEMLLTGRPVAASKAVEIGLINEAFDTVEELDEHVDNLSELIASKSARSIRMGKPAFLRQLSCPDLAEAYEIAGTTMCENAMDNDCAEGIAAFLEKRPPQWRP